jgi:hypothetical protein
LAVATDTKGRETDNISSGKRLAADWNLGLGESAISLKILMPDTETKDTPHKIVVLGVRTLFVLFDSGKLLGTKRPLALTNKQKHRFSRFHFTIFDFHDFFR